MNESATIKYAKNEKDKEKSPWSRYFGEMAQKACIKRASKTWPKTDKHERIQRAVEIINQSEGSDWETVEAHRFKPGEREAIITQMQGALERGDDHGVREVVDEYMTGDPEEQMKFWAIFSSAERSAIKAMTSDDAA